MGAKGFSDRTRFRQGGAGPIMARRCGVSISRIIPAGAAAVINRWVDKATKGKIPMIVDTPNPNTRLVLTDAVYFKGKWTWPFPKEATAPHDFHSGDGGTVKIPMMRLDHALRLSGECRFSGRAPALRESALRDVCSFAAQKGRFGRDGWEAQRDELASDGRRGSRIREVS